MLWLLVVEGVAVAGFVGVQGVGIVGRAGRLLRVVRSRDEATATSTVAECCCAPVYLVGSHTAS